MIYFQKPNKGQQELLYILNAVAKKNSSTGYIQGMNFLAGTILINLQRGEETFWMMMSILNTYKFDSILDLKSGGLFQILCYQLEAFIQHYLPKLHEHFRKHKIPTDIYAANWFITMFCCELSMDLVFCILDAFLLEGIKSLIRVSLAILSCLQERLLRMDDEECMTFLSSSQKDIEMDSQTLLATAFSFKITNSLLLDLELFYKLKTRNKHPLHHKLFKAFNKLSLQDEDIRIVEYWLSSAKHLFEPHPFQLLTRKQETKKKHYWILLPATPDDLRELLFLERTLSAEEIDEFYHQNIKNRKLREIVEEIQTDEDSEIANVNSYAIEKKDIQNAKMLQPSLRKKETLHSKYAQAHSTLSHTKRKPGQFLHFSTDSNNTILELTHDYSKGGYSAGGGKGNKGSQVNQNSSSYAASNFSNGDTNKLIPSSDQKNLHLSLVMRGTDENDMLVTPRGKLKINNDLSTKNKRTVQQTLRKKENESPFIKIVTNTAKSIFGNFFKTQDKLNKSYEEFQGEQVKNNLPASRLDKHNVNLQPSFENEVFKKQTRSKSIHQSVLNPSNYRDSPEIRVTTQTAQYSSKTLNQQAQIHSQSTHHDNQVIMTTMRDQHKLHVTTEDNHNIPNNQPLNFNTTTHLQHQQQMARLAQSIGTGQNTTIQMNQDYFMNDTNKVIMGFGPGQNSGLGVSMAGDISGSQSSPLNNHKISYKVHKHISKSLERGTSEMESMIGGDEDDEELGEDCEIDLLSSSADYAIQTVGDNMNLKRHQEFNGASKRPEILIAKDLVAGEEDQYIESQNVSNQDIQYLRANNNVPLFSINGNQLSQTIKVTSTFTINSNNQHLNFKKQHQQSNYNSNNPRRESNIIQRDLKNIKIMKSSPPVSPKERQQMVIQSQNSLNKQPINANSGIANQNQLAINNMSQGLQSIKSNSGAGSYQQYNHTQNFVNNTAAIKKK
eukprot:403360747